MLVGRIGTGFARTAVTAVAAAGLTLAGAGAAAATPQATFVPNSVYFTSENTSLTAHINQSGGDTACRLSAQLAGRPPVTSGGYSAAAMITVGNLPPGTYWAVLQCRVPLAGESGPVVVASEGVDVPPTVGDRVGDWLEEHGVSLEPFYWAFPPPHSPAQP